MQTHPKCYRSISASNNSSDGTHKHKRILAYRLLRRGISDTSDTKLFCFVVTSQCQDLFVLKDRIISRVLIL